MLKKILCVAMAFVWAIATWAENLKTVMSYYQPEMSKGFIFISKVDMTLTLVNSQGDVVVTYPMACGKNKGTKTTKGDYKTPEGHFLLQQIHDASAWGHNFNDGKGFIRHAYGPYFLRLKTGFQGIGIHGTHAPESIGTRATEGCIRLENSTLESLVPLVKLGMPVIIGPEQGVDELIAHHVPSPTPQVWGKTGKPSDTQIANRVEPTSVNKNLKVVDGMLDIDTELDLSDVATVSSNSLDLGERLSIEVPAVLVPNLTELTQQVASADKKSVAPANQEAKSAETVAETKVEPMETEVTTPRYEVVVEEVTLPDGTIKYEVKYKPI